MRREAILEIDNINVPCVVLKDGSVLIAPDQVERFANIIYKSETPTPAKELKLAGFDAKLKQALNYNPKNEK